MKKFMSIFMASAIIATLLPMSVFADDATDTNTETTAETVELVADLVSTVDVTESVTSEDAVEGEVTVTETVAESDFSDEAFVELRTDWSSLDYPQAYLLSVRWGFFGEDRVKDSETTYDSDGTISFEGQIISKPARVIKFEKDEDSIDFDNTDEHSLAFVSVIHGGNDGVSFRVKADPDATDEDEATIVFNNSESSSEQSVTLNELIDADGEMTIDLGNYDLKLRLWTRDEWISEQSERASIGNVAGDADKSAWYAKYMNVAVGGGLFSGYKDTRGKMSGKIGPNDTLTRLQLLKVAYELSKKLNLGAYAVSSCDPKTVTATDEVTWLGDNWAKGYVQCIYDSNLDITLLSKVINGDLNAGNTATFRWEVVATVFEMLDLTVSSDASSDLTDLDGLSDEVESMVNTAVELGIITGYSDGTFQPGKTVNRAEMFKIVSLFYEAYAM